MSDTEFLEENVMTNNLKIKMQVLAKEIRQHYGLKNQNKIAKDVGVAQATISNILSGGATGLSPEVVRKVAKKLGTDPKKYILHNVNPEKFASANNSYVIDPEDTKSISFKSVCAYDMPTGITYIGKLQSKSLEDACMIQTTEIAYRCMSGHDSVLDVLRGYYESMARISALSNLRAFTTEKTLAKYKL